MAGCRLPNGQPATPALPSLSQQNNAQKSDVRFAFALSCSSLAARPVRTVTAASARRTASAGLARRALSFRPCRVARRNAVCVVEEAPKSKPAPKPKKISQLDLVEEELGIFSLVP